MRNVLILLLSLICMVSCMNVGTYDNPVYGTLDVRKIDSPQEINGYPCKKGKVTFYENDSLMGFVLSKDFEINGDMIPADSEITMYWNGKPEFIYLSEETEIQGYTPRTKKIAYWHVSFFNNGNLSLFSLKEDTVIDGVPCSKDADLQLLPNGKLWRCTLSEDFESHDKSYVKGTDVVFDENGTPFKYSLEKYEEINNRLNIHEYMKRFYSHDM